MALTKTLTFNLTATLTGTITSTEQSSDVPLTYQQDVTLDPGQYVVSGVLTIPDGGQVTLAFINPELTTTITNAGAFSWIVTITTQTSFSAASSGSGVFGLADLAINPHIPDEL